ncbi:MAG: hypothetical protein JNJ57_11995, partial [Saprospiraceae bacterium]|nr:hypothetical protein [Saprospiraceae bacterium]
LLAARAQEFNQEDLTDVYQYAINHCNIQIMKARESYVQEAFDLYVESVSSGVLLENRILSPWHFKNIINLGLKLKKYAWTEAFIESHTQLLAPEFQPDALHYNLALLYYSTGRHDDALLHLNRVEYSDIHYSTGAKVMLCQIYFQNDDIDALESLIHAFNTYLRRNRLISENVRQVYLNFILIMRKVMRARPQQYPAIAQEVQKMRVLAAKDWLLKILGESS